MTQILGAVQPRSRGSVPCAGSLLTATGEAGIRRGRFHPLLHCSKTKQSIETKLPNLDLAGNRIGYEGVGRLAAVLEQCQSLVHLDLRWNHIEETAPSAAARRHLCHRFAALRFLAEHGSAILQGITIIAFSLRRKEE